MPRLKGSANREAASTIFEDRIAKKPPQCRVFSCSRDYRAAHCCWFCRRKYSCASPCLNCPAECGMVVIPRRRQKPQKGDDADEDDD